MTILIFSLTFLLDKKNLATTYFPSRVTRKYLRHTQAWLLCSEWEQVFPWMSSSLENFCMQLFIAHSKIHRWNFVLVLRFLLPQFCVLWLSPRFISIGQLNTLLHLHLQPIYHIVYVESYYLTVWDILSWGGLHT